MHSMENGGWDFIKSRFAGMSQKLLSFSGQMNEPPGARARVWHFLDYLSLSISVMEQNTSR
jgi:F0F1-type ATP synthase beta subunit